LKGLLINPGIVLHSVVIEILLQWKYYIQEIPQKACSQIQIKTLLVIKNEINFKEPIVNNTSQNHYIF
jgi:hypothetical protein